MRVLVVSNMAPTPSAPERGSFVRDQVRALRAIGELEVDLHEFRGGRTGYLLAAISLRRILHRGHYELVHAHYGLTGWVALAAGARPLMVTFHGTDVRHRLVGPLSRSLVPRLDLAAVVSPSLLEPDGGRPGLPSDGPIAVLPCGADLSRFAARPRHEARERLGLDPAGRYLLLPADPERPGKRADRAREVAERTGAELLTAGGVAPQEMPDLVNAAACVLVTSDAEGFGLAAIEALACEVPVLATPVGALPDVLAGVDGCLVAEFEAELWAEAAAEHLDRADPRVAGRDRAAEWSAERCAERVADTYRELAVTSAARRARASAR